MMPDRVLNPGSLTYKSGALPTALHGPAFSSESKLGNVYLLLYFCPNIWISSSLHADGVLTVQCRL